ncbi:hypothetical protein HDU97_003337 [Phlyctochytrium planicorne]|nr:hypothetical protein HDU97_003337 [Phlyctochytrium planicorne]
MGAAMKSHSSPNLVLTLSLLLNFIFLLFILVSFYQQQLGEDERVAVVVGKEPAVALPVSRGGRVNTGEGKEAAEFSLFVMGSSGGPVEATTSGYLLKAYQSTDNSLLAFEAGTLLHGISLLQRNQHLPSTPSALEIYQKWISGYLISHTHLDHTLALLVNSQSALPNRRTPIYATPFTLDGFRKGLFNNVTWPDVVTLAGVYAYRELGSRDGVKVDGMELEVKAFGVSHGVGMLSTCFLVSRVGGSAVLLCGDMGADSREGNRLNLEMWTRIAPLVAEGRLRAIMLECSFGSDRPDGLLFGHLTPRLVVEELGVLRRLVEVRREEMVGLGITAGKSAFEGLTVVVGHVKDDGVLGVREHEEVLRKEFEGFLPKDWDDVEFVFARQGMRIDV